jgi:hypothetical protein
MQPCCMASKLLASTFAVQPQTPPTRRFETKVASALMTATVVTLSAGGHKKKTRVQSNDN